MVHIETKAYGKVNIGLKVGGKREDGYHDIDSYFLLIPFFDELSFSLEDGKYSVDIEGNQGYLAEGKTDIMEKAAGIYSEATGLEFSLSIGIKKHIPDKAGLGGGSSDAASVLLFLNGLFKALDEKSLLELSSKVGADVPFFVSKAKLARIKGIGDIIQPMEYSLPYKYVSLFRAPGSGVSTKEAYDRLDMRNIGYSPLPSLSFPLKREDFPNDFELLEGRGMLEKIKGLMDSDDYASLSGSGSVWFLLSERKISSDIEEFIGSKEINVMD